MFPNSHGNHDGCSKPPMSVSVVRESDSRSMRRVLLRAGYVLLLMLAEAALAPVTDALAAGSPTVSPPAANELSGGLGSGAACPSAAGQANQELVSSNAVIRSYAWDTMGRQLYLKSGSSVYYQITNPHGDNVAWASASALVGTEHFDPWGNLLNSGGTTTPFGFQGAAGSWTDTSTGFVSMGARWYYPKISEFLSSDPAAGTASPRTPIDRMRWLYGVNDPLTNSDPTGLCRPYPDCLVALENQDVTSQQQSAAVSTSLCDRESCPGSTQYVPTTYAPAPPKHSNSANSGAGHSWLVIGGYDVGQHLGNVGNALGGAGTIRPDWSQLTPENLGNAAAGWGDEGVGSAIDLGCMSAELVCDVIDPQHHRDHLVSDAVDAMGGHVDRNSDAYRDGQIAFVVGSVAAGAPGLVRSAPTLVRAGFSLFRAGTPEALPLLRPVTGGAPDLLQGEIGLPDAERLPYEPSNPVYGQANPSSCIAAACRMVHQTVTGQNFGEAYWRAGAGVDETGGTLSGAAEALNMSGLQATVREGLSLPELRDAAASGPAIVQGPGHAVVVDAVEEGGVLIRDPWNVGIGAAYRVTSTVFQSWWTGRAVLLGI